MINNKRASLILTVIGLACILLSLFMLQFGAAAAQDSGGVALPSDFRYWFHIGSKSITAAGAKAAGLPDTVFGNTFDAVFANSVALNDMRSKNTPYRDGAVFVAAFYKLENPVAGLDAPGDLAFTAVMEKDSKAYASTGGWGFDAFAPDGTRITDLHDTCFACHQSQSKTDFVFSTLSERTPSAFPASDNGVFVPPAYRSMYWRGSKVIRPDAATALGLPTNIFGDTFDSVYANTEAVQALSSETRPFPVGTLFVADFHKAAYPIDGLAGFGDEAFTAVMLKGAPGTGDDKSTGDWKFEAFGPDGTPLKDLRGACISCHATKSANDYVFTGS